MTLMAVKGINSRSDATTNSWPTADITCAVGDLCVILIPGNASFQSPGTAPAGGANANWHQMGPNPMASTSTDRARCWWKLIEAGDLTSGTKVAAGTFTAGTGGNTGRLMGGIWNDANGFDVSTCLVEALDSETSISNGTTAFAPQNKARRQVIIVLFENLGTGQPSLTVTWDGGTAQAPYIDESSSTQADGVAGHHYGTGLSTMQADFKLYDVTDTPSTVAFSAGLANTSHIVFLANFQAKPTPTPIGTASEVDTAQPFGRAAHRTALGTASEVDTAQPFGHGRFFTTASEVDTALPLGRVHTHPIGTAPETDTAGRLGHGFFPASEVDTAQPLGVEHGGTEIFSLPDPGTGSFNTQILRVRTLAVTGSGSIRFALIHSGAEIAVYDWAALPSVLTTIPLTVVTPLGGFTGLTCSVSVRSPGALVAEVVQVELEADNSTVTALETDTAQPLGRVRHTALGTALETDAARGLGRVRFHPLGTSSEVDTPGFIPGGPPARATVVAGGAMSARLVPQGTMRAEVII